MGLFTFLFTLFSSQIKVSPFIFKYLGKVLEFLAEYSYKMECDVNCMELVLLTYECPIHIGNQYEIHTCEIWLFANIDIMMYQMFGLDLCFDLKVVGDFSSVYHYIILQFCTE